MANLLISISVSKSDNKEGMLAMVSLYDHDLPVSDPKRLIWDRLHTFEALDGQVGRDEAIGYAARTLALVVDMMDNVVLAKALEKADQGDILPLEM